MLILNYPRCGSNFLYYSIKEITNISYGKSHGQNKEFWQNKETDYKLIFMIRNYKECIPRQIDNYTFGELFKSQISNLRTTNEMHHFDYISVLDYYDKYEGDKVIVYYEDLILNIHSVLTDVIKFILGDNFNDKTSDSIKNYIDNIDHHKKKSSERYQSLTLLGCKSINNENVDIFHHSKKMDKNDLLMIDKYLNDNYKYLYNKYLYRYSETK
jgi:hypothetical protein